MTPSISSLSLSPMPWTSRSRVSPMAGVPITRWPRRRGGRGPANTAGARSSTRTVAPGALGTTGAGGGRCRCGFGHPDDKLDAAGRVDDAQLAVGEDRRGAALCEPARRRVEVLGSAAAELDPDEPAEVALIDEHRSSHRRSP